MDKTLIEKVKELLFETEEKFLDVKTSDGLVLRVSEVEEGATVTIISEDGENVSGAADYVLEDGVTISVDENGVITAVSEATEEEEVVVEEEEMEAVVEESNPMEDRMAKLEEGIESILSKFSEMTETVEKFASAPAEKEIVIEKKKPAAFKRETALDGLSKFRNNKK